MTDQEKSSVHHSEQITQLQASNNTMPDTRINNVAIDNNVPNDHSVHDAKTFPIRVVPESTPTFSDSHEAMKDDYGLVLACEKGSLKAVKFLLEQYPTYYNDINKVYVGQYGVS